MRRGRSKEVFTKGPARPSRNQTQTIEPQSRKERRGCAKGFPKIRPFGIGFLPKMGRESTHVSQPPTPILVQVQA